MRIGFTCGSFDLLHAGHVLALCEAAKRCDYLIVGLQSDPTLDRRTKNKPIQSIEERKIQLLGCRHVDEVWIYDTEAQLYAYLWEMRNRIDVRFLGADWKDKQFTAHDVPIHCVFTDRSHNYSTSELRERIMASAKPEDLIQRIENNCGGL